MRLIRVGQVETLETDNIDISSSSVSSVASHWLKLLSYLQLFDILKDQDLCQEIKEICLSSVPALSLSMCVSSSSSLNYEPVYTSVFRSAYFAREARVRSALGDA